MNAQRAKGEFIKVAIGLGLSAPDKKIENDINFTGTGFYANGEYVLGLSGWFALRPYASFIFTDAATNNQQNPFNYKITNKALMIGGKVRILAPIPYFAPYFEVGVGLSAGSFQTYTPYANIDKNGVVPHIPFTVGVALGKNNKVDVAFVYYFHSSVEQFSGGLAFGYTFPLGKK